MPYKYFTTAVRGSVRSTRGLGPTMTARGQSIGISIGVLPQTLIMSRLDQLSRLGALMSSKAKWRKHFEPVLINVAARTTTETLVERSVSRSRQLSCCGSYRLSRYLERNDSEATQERSHLLFPGQSKAKECCDVYATHLSILG